MPPGMSLLLSITRIRRPHPCRLAAAPLLAILVAGCGVSPPSQPGSVLHGQVRGGQQPVANAAISLYAAGSSGNGVGATNLLAPNIVATDASGNFNVTSDYLCPSATTQVYLVARGGNPGLAPAGNAPVDNAALILMAALGDCGTLSSTTNITVNEATTAASAWALAQFLGPGALAGSTASNASGLRNAFAAARNLADPSTGLVPGSALPPGAVTEAAKLNTLANILAACVNSDGVAACAPLFAASSTSQGAPANTLDAALNIVRNPAANIVAIYNAAAAQGPFQPALAAAPHDWSISITYGGCTSGCGALNVPSSLAIDSGGNILVANYFGAAVSKFSPSGTALFPNGIPGLGLNQSYGIAIDASDNVWVTNQQSVSAAGNHRQGSVSEFNSAGAELSGNGYTTGGIYFPLAAAADANGHIWIADYGDSSATLLANDGTPISTAAYGASQIPFPSAVAVDASHNAWFAAQGEAVRVSPAGAVTVYPCCNAPAGIAVDQAGSIWIADYSASAIVELSPSGSVMNRTALLSSGMAGPQGIAVDGAGNVWAANYYGNSLAELNGPTAAVLSPALGFGLDAPLSEPYGLAIDASGSLWLSNAGSSAATAFNTLTQFVGLASPVKTPLLGPPVKP